MLRFIRKSEPDQRAPMTEEGKIDAHGEIKEQLVEKIRALPIFGPEDPHRIYAAHEGLQWPNRSHDYTWMKIKTIGVEHQFGYEDTQESSYAKPVEAFHALEFRVNKHQGAFGEMEALAKTLVDLLLKKGEEYDPA
jgi:hypothetical protein